MSCKFIKQKTSFLRNLFIIISVFCSLNTSISETDLTIDTNTHQYSGGFGPVIEILGKKENKETTQELGILIPVFETNSTLGLVDVKSKINNKKSKQINLGVAVRHNFNDSLIFGLYTYFDPRKKQNHFNIIGTEFLTVYLDARVNFYISQDKKKKSSVNNIYKQNLFGYEFELGIPLLPKIGTKLFVSSYQFSTKSNLKIKGTRFRLEQQSGSFDIGYSELRITLHIETQKDKLTKEQISAGISAKLLFNSLKEKYSFRSRMMDTILRNPDRIINKKSEEKVRYILSENEDKFSGSGSYGSGSYGSGSYGSGSYGSGSYGSGSYGSGSYGSGSYGSGSYGSGSYGSGSYGSGSYGSDKESYYGDISNTTGLPKTTYVNQYYRQDGTYVKGHYRSKK